MANQPVIAERWRGTPMERVYTETRTPEELTPDEWQLIETKVKKAIFQLIMLQAFFGLIAVRLAEHTVYIRKSDQLRDDPDKGPFRTMAVDGRNLYVWPFFALYYPQENITAFVYHELLHLILGHCRPSVGRDRVLENIAMDYTVNLIVNDAAIGAAEGMRQGERVKPDNYRRLPWYFPIDQGFCYDEIFRTKDGNPWAWEEVYQHLLAHAKVLKPGEKPGEGSYVIRDGQGPFDHHEMWGNRNGRPTDEQGNQYRGPVDLDQIRKWSNAAMAALGGKLAGSMPAYLERSIREWLDPPLPWQNLLHPYAKPVQGDFSWAPGDPRFPDPLPFWEPKFEPRTIACFFDTSGSMSEAEISESYANFEVIMSAYPHIDVVAACCDADVASWARIRKGEKFVIAGGGGTAFAPPMDRLKAEGDQVDVAIYFTDGYGSWPNPDDYDFPVLWVITNEQITPPEHPKWRYTRFKRYET